MCRSRLVLAVWLVSFVAAAPLINALTPEELAELKVSNETAWFEAILQGQSGEFTTENFFTVFDVDDFYEERYARGSAMAASEEPMTDDPVVGPMDVPNPPPPPPGTYQAIASGPWTSPAIWNSTAPGTIPSPGSNVTIPANRTVTLPSALALTLNTVWVYGQLICGSTTTGTKLAITLQSLRVRGSSARLQCGTLAAPFLGDLNVTLTGNTVGGDAVRSIVADQGGVVALNGAPKRPWTRLASNFTAWRGNTSITVEGPIGGWNVGDKIIISPTDHYPDQTDEAAITAIDPVGGGNFRLTLDAALLYNHNAGRYSIPHQSNGKTYTLDARAEVAVLTRNIVIQGDRSTLVGDMASGFVAAPDSTNFGGDVRVFDAGALQFSYTEHAWLGKYSQLGRYPFHVHNVGSTGNNSYGIGLSVHHSFQRCMVVHCTDNTYIANNTCYNIVGFAWMLEDGAESNNTFIGNLGVLTHAAGALVATEDILAATFWFLNPGNHFIENVAVAAYGPGYMLDLGSEMMLRFSQVGTCRARIPGLVSVNPNHVGTTAGMGTVQSLLSIPMGVFKNNVVHSSKIGLWFVGRGAGLIGLENGPRHIFDGTVIYKLGLTYEVEFEACLHTGVFYNLWVTNTICANSFFGTWHARANPLIKDWVFAKAPIVEGRPGTPPYKGAFANQQLRAFTFYNQPVYVDKVHFWNVPNTPLRRGMTQPAQYMVMAFSVGDDGNLSKMRFGPITTTDASGLLPQYYVPAGVPWHVIDESGSVSGLPGRLLVPMAPCAAARDQLDSFINTTVCPRRVDPLVAYAQQTDRNINCSYIDSAGTYACSNIATRGLWMQVFNDDILQRNNDTYKLAIRAPNGTLLVNVTGFTPSIPEILKFALPVRRSYVLSMPAMSHVGLTRVSLRVGFTETPSDFLRLTLLNVPRQPNITGVPFTTSSNQFVPPHQIGLDSRVASIAAVNRCTTGFCWFFQRTPGNAAGGNVHMMVRAGNRVSPHAITLSGQRAKMYDFVLSTMFFIF